MSVGASEYDYLLKVILVGDSGVGKSSIVQRFAGHGFSEKMLSTIGVDFHIAQLTEGGKRFKIQTWDCAGLEKFASITASYYRGAHAALIVYDVSDPTSYMSVKKWVADVRHHKPDTLIFIVGNKSDLKPPPPPPSSPFTPTSATIADKTDSAHREITSVCKNHDINHPVILTSAKNNHNIQHIFRLIANTYLDDHHHSQTQNTTTTTDRHKKLEHLPIAEHPQRHSCCPIL